MSVVVYEHPESRRSTEGENPSVELIFTIEGTDDEGLALLNLLYASPLVYAGLVRKERSVDPVGPDLWRGVVTYARRKPKETGDSSYQFEVGGQQQKITQTLQRMGAYAPAGQQVPDTGGAIGVTKDSVEGCEIYIPTYQFSETHYLPVATVTPAYKARLFTVAAAPVNLNAWRGFQPGEVLFLGASGSQRGEEDWEVSYKFVASPNMTGIQCGNIAGISKRGWDYLWILYEDKDDDNAKMLVKRPRAVYVDRVYGYSDFSLLGIGT